MEIAILTATQREMLPVRKALEEGLHPVRRYDFRFIVTGVGLMHSTHSMAKAFALHRPDLAIQAGIAGAFDANRYKPGSTVAVHSETLGDAGALETDGNWKDLFDLGLGDPDQVPYASKRLVNPSVDILENTGLPRVAGVTVNTVSSERLQIERLKAFYAPDVESMEGAALHYVCLQEGIPFLQLRGISNEVGEREKRNWRIDEAMAGLQDALTDLLLRLYQKGKP